MRTKKQAYALTVKVWRYLAAHPEIETKRDLPRSLYQRIEKDKCECPLCSIFYPFCRGCPLFEANDWCLSLFGSSYSKWVASASDDFKARFEVATHIADTVQKALDALEASKAKETK